MKFLMAAIGFVVGAFVWAPVGFMTCALLSVNKLNHHNNEYEE